jgi:hypothetical protein
MRCCIKSDCGTPPDEATPKDSFYCLRVRLRRRPPTIQSGGLLDCRDCHIIRPPDGLSPRMEAGRIFGGEEFHIRGKLPGAGILRAGLWLPFRLSPEFSGKDLPLQGRLVVLPYHREPPSS